MKTSHSLKTSNFPSYRAIQAKVIELKKAPLQRKLNHLRNQINKLEASMDVKEQHRKVRDQLIGRRGMSASGHRQFQHTSSNVQNIPPEYQQFQEGTDSFSKTTTSSCQFQPLTQGNRLLRKVQIKEGLPTQSLNKMVPDLMADEGNHYQTYLKFKIQSLQRELEEEQIAAMPVRRNSKNQELFRNLHKRQRKPTNSITGTGLSNGQSGLNGVGGGSSSEDLCAKRQKFLYENFPEYMKKFENLNIVIWRFKNNE